MKEVGEKELLEGIIKKHENFLKEYGKEFEQLDGVKHTREELKKKLSVLREKQSQLEHWINDSDNGEKFTEEKRKADSEINNITTALEGLPQIDEARHRELKGVVEKHKKALEYWNERKTDGKGA